MGVEYWLAYWWVVPIALGICVLVCLVGIEGSILFVPFYAVVFPWLTARPLTPLEAIQVGLIAEIFGFSSSFVGFYHARLIDWRVGLVSTAAGAPLALGGAVLAYRLPQAVLLLVVAAALPLLAWYLRRPVEAETEPVPKDRERQSETALGAARHIPMCCYVSDVYYRPEATNADAQPVTATPQPQMHEHRDRSGRTYRYTYRGGRDRLLVSAAGGLATGVVGLGIGVLGVAHLILRRMPVRVAVGTSHLVILLVTGVAVAVHLIEIIARGQSPPWNIIAANVVAVLVGGQLAAWLAGRLAEERMRRVLVSLLLGLAAVTLYRAVRMAG